MMLLTKTHICLKELEYALKRPASGNGLEFNVEKRGFEVNRRTAEKTLPPSTEVRLVLGRPCQSSAIVGNYIVM